MSTSTRAGGAAAPSGRATPCSDQGRGGARPRADSSPVHPVAARDRLSSRDRRGPACHDGAVTSESRVSRRIAAIAESATLAVDAKAKALKAAGEPVIGFGAGRAGLPDPRAHRRSRGRGVPEPGATTGTRRPRACPNSGSAIAAKTARDSRLRRARRPRCSSPTAASTRSTTRSRRCSTRATRCCSRRRTGPPTPRRSRSPVAEPWRCRTTEATGFRVTVDQLEAARTANTKALLFVSPSNPTGAVYPPEEVEAIGRWALEHGIWVVTDEIYEHLTFGEHRVHVDARARPRARRHLRRAERGRQDVRDDRVGASAG